METMALFIARHVQPTVRHVLVIIIVRTARIIFICNWVYVTHVLPPVSYVLTELNVRRAMMGAI